MNIIINGDTQTVPDHIETVQQLLTYLHLQDRIVVVEINRTILQKDAHAATPVREGDIFELVHFVGGG